MSFSDRTIGALVIALAEGNRHSQLGTLFMSLGVSKWDPGEEVNKERRVQRVLMALRESEDEASAKTVMNLVQSAVSVGGVRSGKGRQAEVPWRQPLIDALAADGWEYDDESSRLTPVIPGVSVPEETSGLEAELEDRGWMTSLLHFRRAASGFGSGDWESANGQLRSFLEDFLPRVAEVVAGKLPSSPGAAIQVLEKEFLDEGEREFLKGLWAMSNERGSHPGESSGSESTFRLLVVTATARFLLSRLPGAGS